MAKPIANAGTSPAAAPFSDLPIASEALSFSGTPGTGGSSITHYRSWILDKPTGSSASLSNNAIATPNLLNIDTPGTVVVFVQVADNRFDAGLTPDPWEHATNEPYVSVADPRSAPDSAFVVVSVKTEHLDAEIPGAWERNWRAKYEDFVGKVDVARSDLDSHTIASHDTTATGAQLNTLTGGGDASALHTHATITTLAAVGTAGMVELATAPADAGHPKAVTRQIVKMTQAVLTATAIAIPDGQEVFVFEVPNLIDYGAFKLRRVNMIQCDGWNGVWRVRTCTTSEFLSGIMGDSLQSINPVSTSFRQQQGATFDPPHPMGGDDLIVLTHDAPTAVPGSPAKHIFASVELELQH